MTWMVDVFSPSGVGRAEVVQRGWLKISVPEGAFLLSCCLIVSSLVFCGGGMVPRYPDATDTKGLCGLHKGDAGLARSLELQQQGRRAGPKGGRLRRDNTRCTT